MKNLGLVIATFFAFILVGCGDVSDTTSTGTTNTTTTPTTTTPTTTTPTTTTPTTTTPTTTTPTTAYTMTLVPALTSLSAGGTTAVKATIMANGIVDTTQVVSVTFDSSCTGQGKSTMDSPVVSSAGVAVSTYTDIKCASTDTLGASATINGATISASAQLTVQAAAMGSIQFVGANPANIGIKGVGLTETSLVQFQVKDVLGQSAPAGLGVTFSLDTTKGGITFSPSNTVTDANGLVSTTITSGTLPATVRVTATLDSNTSIKSQSDGLVISTGISDQNSFTLSADVLNVEGWDYNSATVVLTINASDHFNNPVPDGTVALFRTEGGSIQSTCTLLNGTCNVTWTSTNPKPSDGRVTVLATMTGEESFVDSNGNNLYDLGEVFTDLPEAWVDDNESGLYDNGTEEFADFNTSLSYTSGDGLYNGVLCASGCGTAKSLDVRESIVLVMSDSHFTINLTPASFTIAANGIASGYATICGADNNQHPVSGTKISATLDGGTVTMIGGDTALDTNANACYRQYFSIKAGGTAISNSPLEIKALTPKGNPSYGYAPVTVTVP